MKIVSLLLIFLTLFAQDKVKKVVYDLTTGDIKTFEKKILSGISYNKIYYENNFDELKVAVVIHGDAYKFFIDDLNNSLYKNDAKLQAVQNDIGARIKGLSSMYNVKFLMCSSGRKKLKIDKKNIYKFVKFTPNATIGLIDKQQEGFAYISVDK